MSAYRQGLQQKAKVEGQRLRVLFLPPAGLPDALTSHLGLLTGSPPTLPADQCFAYPELTCSLAT